MNSNSTVYITTMTLYPRADTITKNAHLHEHEKGKFCLANVHHAIEHLKSCSRRKGDTYTSLISGCALINCNKACNYSPFVRLFCMSAIAGASRDAE